MQQQTINVNLDNKTSVKEAVKTLTRLTKELLDTVPYKNSLQDLCLPLISVDDSLLSKEALKEQGFSAAFSANDEHNVISTNAQCLLLKKALDFALEEEVLNFAKEVVTFSVRVNESDDLWCNSHMLYGFDMLRTIADHTEAYFHFLFEFVTPNWDEEHNDAIAQYLHLDVSTLTRSKLKALAYANNDNAFLTNFLTFNEIYEEVSDGSLYEYFKKNPNEYAYFKEEHLNSLKQYPRNNSISFVLIVGDRLQECLSESFYTSTLEEEIAAFNKEIQETLTHFKDEEFVFEYKSSYDEEDEYFTEEESRILGSYKGFQEEEDEETVFMNKEFFQKSLVNAEKIIAYITDGTNENSLEELTVIEDLRAFATHKELSILKRFIYDGDDFENFSAAFMYEQESIKKDGASAKQRVARVINVLLRLKGELLGMQTIKGYVANGYFTLEEFFKKNYAFVDKELLLESIEVLEFSVECMSKEDLETLFCMYMYDKELFVQHLPVIKTRQDLVTTSSIALEPFKSVTGNYLALLAYLVNKGMNKSSFLSEYRECVFKVYAYMLKEMSNDLDAQVSEYISDKKSMSANVLDAEDMQGLLASILYIYKFLDNEEQTQLKKVFALFIELDEEEVLEEVAKSFTQEEFDALLEVLDL